MKLAQHIRNALVDVVAAAGVESDGVQFKLNVLNRTPSLSTPAAATTSTSAFLICCASFNRFMQGQARRHILIIASSLNSTVLF